MKIIHKIDALHVLKPEGLKTWYYLFNEYELHYNEQNPKTEQVWHHHEKNFETIFIVEGKLTAKWSEGKKIKKQIVKKGDLIETQKSSHTFINQTNKVVKFIVIKQVLSGKNKRNFLKKDKVLD